METSHCPAKIKTFYSDGLYNSLKRYVILNKKRFNDVKLLLPFRDGGVNCAKLVE